MSTYPHSGNASLLGPVPQEDVDLDPSAPTDFATAFGPFAGSEPIHAAFNGICVEQPSERERREHHGQGCPVCGGSGVRCCEFGADRDPREETP